MTNDERRTNPQGRRTKPEGARTLANLALLRARHRRQRLLAVTRELNNPALSARQLRDHCRYEGLEPSLADCTEVLAELYPQAPVDGATSPAQRPRSVREYVLEAARLLRQPFSLSELVVLCWQQAPALFSLDGYEEYPDPQPVRCVLYGRRGLVARGELVRAGLRFQVRAGGSVGHA
jgi:hypothetical protein